MNITSEVILTIVGSIGLGSLTTFLVYINWKILRVSRGILKVSIDLLKETIVIRKETVLIRELSEEILIESIKMRKNLDMPIDTIPKNKRIDVGNF